MKWACITLFILYLNPVTVCSQISSFAKTNASGVSAEFDTSDKVNFTSNLFLIQFVIKKRSDLTESIGDYVAFLLLWITTFLTILTPLVLIYLWIYYSHQYVKKYRHIFSVKQWLFGKRKLNKTHLTDAIRLSYRKVYSLMIGFGIAIIAYSIASLRFMLLNFDKMETALIQYFKFPFLALDEFGLTENNLSVELKFEYFWNQMLLIVIISAMFFLIGYLIGSLVVDLRFKFINKQIQKSRLRIKAKKEMFSLKITSQEIIPKEAETIAH